LGVATRWQTTDAKGAGVPLMQQYRDQGLDMLWEHAQFEDKSVGVEAGLIAWLDRMKSERFDVFRELNDFWAIIGATARCLLKMTICSVPFATR
jgi:hypothetical protein